MAPQKKITSSTGCVYEQNNFTAFLTLEDAPTDFHLLMRFLAQCKVSKALSGAPIIVCSFVEELWNSAEVSQDGKSISYSCKCTTYSITAATISECFSIPENNYDAPPTVEEIRNMLATVNYAKNDASLGEIVRKNLRKE